MTIGKGEAWGVAVARPAGLVVLDDDAALVEDLDRDHRGDGDAPDGPPRALRGGDLFRTLGGRDVAARAELLEVPIDLLAVTTDVGQCRAAAHVTIRRPRRRGGWWFGPVVMVMNAEFLGDWHVVARGHPNDGRAETCEWGADFGFRRRWQARRRLPTGTHVPHPQIRTGTFRERSWSFDESLDVFVDGRRIGRSRTLVVSVVPDATHLHI